MTGLGQLAVFFQDPQRFLHTAAIGLQQVAEIPPLLLLRMGDLGARIGRGVAGQPQRVAVPAGQGLAHGLAFAGQLAVF